MIICIFVKRAICLKNHIFTYNLTQYDNKGYSRRSGGFRPA